MLAPEEVATVSSQPELRRRDGIVPRTCVRPGCGKALVGRQEKFCSSGKGGCRQLAWEEANPRVSPTHSKRVAAGSIAKALLDVMADGSFRTVQQLAEAVGALPASVSARIRELRAKGHAIRRDKLVGDVSEAHRYALKTEPAA